LINAGKMNGQEIYLGNNKLNTHKAEVKGQFVFIEKEKYYQIENFHEMPDFFMSIGSDSDHWMFISSNGSLSAGRKNRDNALFPYYTEDKIHDYHSQTGSKTYFQVHDKARCYLWEPFKKDHYSNYSISRNLYKSVYGNKLIFEELNHDLGIAFQYAWLNSAQYGFVKKSRVINIGESDIRLSILDGLKNILPYGIDYTLQNEFSNLIDAYKKNELLPESNLALFTLSAIPIDKAEPSEALKATTVWSAGIEKDSIILISDQQVRAFLACNKVEEEYNIRASRGAYFINSNIALPKNGAREWYTIADINQDSADVINLLEFISSTSKPEGFVLTDVETGTANLRKLVSFADGLQRTNSETSDARHFSNILYNIMRGGIFVNDSLFDKNDFIAYLENANTEISNKFNRLVQNMPEPVSQQDIYNLAKETGNPDFIRIAFEYLPLSYSRRHGDPSRPWNYFNIETMDSKGKLRYNYEGNWRDIFQNWEALCYSYPSYIESFIFKFVNASTIDGYNPYRIMKDGIDWEEPDHNSWTYLGYWGDHQIIYLLKLLELSSSFHPGVLDSFLSREIFTYARVPYRIKSFLEIARDPKNTIDFDDKLNQRIKQEVIIKGADARLLWNTEDTNPYRVNLTEKLLVSLLSKLSNFIPEAGIWMNTQRPEWNDANNALVGNGASMVTLYYLRQFVKFLHKSFIGQGKDTIAISEEVADLFYKTSTFYKERSLLTGNKISDRDRREFVDYCGHLHSDYRQKVYQHGFSGIKKNIPIPDLTTFFEIVLSFIEHTIKANKRQDGLYHAYNLISISDDGISIRHLHEMLEGQVAVLNSGYLSPEECLQILDQLKRSKLYRADQNSYILYPDKSLPGFTEKNIIPEEDVMNSALLRVLIEDGEESIIKKDRRGHYHFNSTFKNAKDLKLALLKLKETKYTDLIDDEMSVILALHEDVFDHQSFTGRAGTFFAYEGLGSIYWHMVSKLLLTVQECFFAAEESNADPSVVERLRNHYYDIKDGIGMNKSPELYGACPMEAYSHTPANTGVKQPGLTGQVKEDIISRLGELGIRIKAGEITFSTSLLNKKEFLEESADFVFHLPEKGWEKLQLVSQQLAFSFCQVPIVYSSSKENKIRIIYNNDESVIIDGCTIDRNISNELFGHSRNIKKVEVKIECE
jgi:hypothetical protein